MKYFFLKNIKKIATLFFLMISFIGIAQDNLKDIKVLQDKIKGFEESGDILKKEYRTSINDLAFLYRKEGKLLDTEILLIKVIKIVKENIGEKDMEYAESLYNLAMFYYENHDFIKDEPLFYKALEISKENHGEKNIDYINSMRNVAIIFSNENKFLKAESLLLKAKELQYEISGEKDKNYVEILLSLFKLYSKQGDFNKSKILISNLLNISKDVYGEKTIEYISVLYTNADLYKNHGEYAEAENLFLKTLEILKIVSGEKTKEYTSTLNHLGLTYKEQGRYLEAEMLFKKAIEINKVIVGDKDPEYAASLNNLGLVYEDQGKYIDAEPLYLNAIKIIKATLGKKSNYYGTFINNLAFLYKDFGKFSKAEAIFLEVLEIRKENLGEKNIDYIVSLNNLALVYSDQGKYSDAIPIYLKTIEIGKDVLGEKNPYYATILNNLGVAYVEIRKYVEAEPLLLKSLQIRKEVFGEKNSDYAIALNNLGLMFYNQGNYKSAEPLYIEAMKIVKENLGENHPDFMVLLSNLATFYKNQGKYEKSLFYANQFIKSNHTRIIEDVFTLSENELIDYVNFKNKNLYEGLSFLNDINNYSQEVNKSCYNNGLLIKNLSLRNYERIKKSILKSKNKSLQVKYEQFIENKKKINKLQALPIVNQPLNLKFLLDETERIEKEISKESTTFSDYKKEITISWENIRNKLKNNEVSINIIAFRYWNKKWTDSIEYAAFIVKKDYKVPKFIPLFEEKQLDFLLGKNKTQKDSYRIDKQYLDQSISNMFLKPLQEELKGITTIYLSPTGLGHQIDFAALPVTDNTTLGKKYSLHILSSPAELVDYKVATLDNKNNVELLLYGGIDYNKSTPKVNLDNNKEVVANSHDNLELRAGSGISGFDYIDGTNKEVNQIQLKGSQNGFTTTIFKESEATKESILHLDGRTTPFVLHIATHGFFFSDPIQELPNENNSLEGKAKIYKASDDAMMRSGLVFAGANNYWNKTNNDTTIDNGILTASEISNLDLSACQLVVLSACETGLGEVKGSEGVFGLQRAFKMAGVKNIIMSLWKVPDAQTAQLFDIFYSECFAGKSIHEAFRSAQAKMKVKYSPYYWAGFVLLE